MNSYDCYNVFCSAASGEDVCKSKLRDAGKFFKDNAKKERKRRCMVMSHIKKQSVLK